MQTSLLMAFVRNPQLGTVKTRLAATVGDKVALEIYIELMRHTACLLYTSDAADE